MSNIQLTIDDVEQLSHRALRNCNTNEVNCRAVTRAIVAAELDGYSQHGLACLPAYCEQASTGKINGNVQPELSQPAPTSLCVDALDGFAYPALDAGIEALAPVAHQMGIAGLSIINSSNFAVLGRYVEKLASMDLMALGFANTPAKNASFDNCEPVLGDNPMALAVPDGKKAARLIIDQSASTTSDVQSNNAAFVVELLAAVLTGANLGVQASSFNDSIGESPRTGQFIIVINPTLFCGQNFQAHLQVLTDSILKDPQARLPGQRRMNNRRSVLESGIEISPTEYDKILSYINQ